jgi:hypothetical protein
VAERLPRLDPIAGLAVEPQGLDRIAGRARMVPRSVRDNRPGPKQAGGQLGFPEAAGQVQALPDERQRGAGLPQARQDPGTY